MTEQGDLIDQLNGFYNVQANWDSYGAKKPHGNAIRVAIAFVDEYLRPRDRHKVTPTVAPDGNVVLMFVDAEGDEYNLVFDGDGCLDVREYV